MKHMLAFLFIVGTGLFAFETYAGCSWVAKIVDIKISQQLYYVPTRRGVLVTLKSSGHKCTLSLQSEKIKKKNHKNGPRLMELKSYAINCLSKDNKTGIATLGNYKAYADGKAVDNVANLELSYNFKPLYQISIGCKDNL